MKQKFSTSGALRARTRAFLCALALLSFAPAWADFTITTQVLPAEAAAAGCTVSGAGTYSDGTSVSFTATPASGWIFAQWRPSNANNGYNDARNPRPALSINEDMTMTAFFVPAGTPTYTITQSVNNTSWGRVSLATINIDGLGTNIYEGTIVYLYTDNLGKGETYFVRWSNGYTNYVQKGGTRQQSTQLVTVTGNAEYIAYWSDSPAPATPTHTVSATVSPAGAGSVTITADGYADNAGTYDEGDDVTLTTTAVNRRYQFSHWEESSSTVGSAASYSIDDIDADHTLVAVFEEVPVTIADNENSSYYASTLSTFSTTMDFRLMRTFKAGMWNTVCFPFDLTSAQRGNSGMSGVTFYTLTSVTGDAAVGLDFNVTPLTTETMTARTPYLVQFTGADIVNPVFEDVTLAASAFTNNTSGTNVGETSFFGTVHPTSLEIGENSGYLFLGQNNSLYWPNVNNDIRAFRAYFYSGNSTVQAVRPRARIVVKEQTATSVESMSDESDLSDKSVRKYLHNGVLVIERDGVKYNAVGQPIE